MPPQPVWILSEALVYKKLIREHESTFLPLYDMVRNSAVGDVTSQLKFALWVILGKLDSFYSGVDWFLEMSYLACPNGPCCPLLAVTCLISFVGRITDFCTMSSYLQQEDSLFATMPPLCPIGSHSKVQSPKSVTGGLGAFTKVSLLTFVLGQAAQ